MLHSGLMMSVSAPVFSHKQFAFSPADALFLFILYSEKQQTFQECLDPLKHFKDLITFTKIMDSVLWESNVQEYGCQVFLLDVKNFATAISLMFEARGYHGIQKAPVFR